MNHSLEHSVLHASLDETGDVRQARARQVATLEQTLVPLYQEQRTTGSPEAEHTRRQAIAILESLWEQCRGSYCACRLDGWHRKMSAQLDSPLNDRPLR